MSAPFWCVIYGNKAPVDEQNLAKVDILNCLKTKGYSLVRSLPDTATILRIWDAVANFVTVGGPIVNKWSNKYNASINPKAVIATDSQGNVDISKSTFVKTSGESFPMIDHAIIGVGAKLRPRLQIVELWGAAQKDTAAVVKAFIDGQPSGVYSTPVAGNYTLVGC